MRGCVWNSSVMMRRPVRRGRPIAGRPLTRETTMEQVITVKFPANYVVRMLKVGDFEVSEEQAMELLKDAEFVELLIDDLIILADDMNEQRGAADGIVERYSEFLSGRGITR